MQGLSAHSAACCPHSQIDTWHNLGRNTAHKFAACVSEVPLKICPDVESNPSARKS